MEKIELTKKDIIAVNQQFSRGYFENESSLDYALSHLKQNLSWTKKTAYITRAILIDHIFEDGNKRTAYFVLIYLANVHGYIIEEKKALNIIKRVILKNITSIKKIKDMIENAIAKTN